MSETDRREATAKRSWLRSSMALRIIASSVFIPCFIVVTRRGDYHFLLLIDLVILYGMREFYSMMEMKGVRSYRTTGVVCGLALSWYMFFRSGIYANLFLTLALLLIMGLELTRRDNRTAVYNIATTIMGVVYVAFLASHIVLLRELPRQVGVPYSLGASFVYLAFIVTWASDTGAYFVGSALGRHALIPRISAKKTWEGAAGGLLFSVAGALIARLTFAPYLGLWEAVVLGCVASAVGLVGDLVESMIKRNAEIKDTSGLIPGHGGVLDRFDSLLFTAPLIYYFLKFFIF